jgi:uncharacterized RDD family membrane protein YckC
VGDGLPTSEDERLTDIGPGRRSVALLIDTLITAIAWVPFADTRSRDGVTSISWQGMDFALPVLIGIAYFVLLEGLAGATIGKAVLGIRVRRVDGTRIGLGASALRNLARVVDGFPYVVPYLVGAIAMSRSDRKQRFGDRWAKTVVILVGTERASATDGEGSGAGVAGPQGLPSPPPGTGPAPAPTMSGDLPPPPPA